jgi:hypothetical protein
MSKPGWCYACDTNADPEPCCARGHRAIFSRSCEVLCLDCACSNPAIAREDGCPKCKQAIAALTKLPAKKKRHGACAS